MVRIVRSLLCAVLAVLVAMLVAPEPLAHAVGHADQPSFSATDSEHLCADAAESDRSDHEHAPGQACGDCCHRANCHMKVAPPSAARACMVNRRAVRYQTEGFLAPYGAPSGRDPDPERTNAV